MVKTLTGRISAFAQSLSGRWKRDPSRLGHR
jgi:hypothetical protein